MRTTNHNLSANKISPKLLFGLTTLLLVTAACDKAPRPTAPAPTTLVADALDPQRNEDPPPLALDGSLVGSGKVASGTASIDPDPSEATFALDNSVWQTFTVRTSLDSVLVVVNPTGSDRALEVAGGSNPPTSGYCPAEGNDRPAKGRRNGWSLHLKACAAGETEIIIYDYDRVELARYEVTVYDESPSGYPEQWMDDLPDHAVFNIELVFLDDFPQWQKDEMRWAADLWELAFEEGLDDYYPAEHGLANKTWEDQMLGHAVALPEVIDDVIIYVVQLEATNSDEIGPYDVQAWAGHIATRPHKNKNFLHGPTAAGVIAIHDVELPGWPYQIDYDEIFAHEIGHVLGIGTSWFQWVIQRENLYFESEFDVSSPTRQYLTMPSAQKALAEMGSWPTDEVPLTEVGDWAHWATYPLGNSALGLAGYILEPRITKVDLAVLTDLGYDVGQPPTRPTPLMRKGVYNTPNGYYRAEGWNAMGRNHPRAKHYYYQAASKPTVGADWSWCGVGRK